MGCTATFCFGLTGTQIPGWTVTENNVDLLRTDYWPPHSGMYSLDLSGYDAGKIEQIVCTKVGFTYHVDFYLNGNGNIGDVRTVQVLATGNAAANYPFTILAPISATNYIKQTYTFTAITASTVLSFKSLNPGTAGPVLDDITIDGTTICCVDECKNFSFPGTQGYFCDANKVGFCQCLNGVFAPQSAHQDCAPGTHCSCNFGVECSANGSPCVTN